MRDEFFAEQMARLSGLRYRPSAYTGHYDVLHHLPEPILADAVTRILATQDDFPTPALLLREAEALRPVLEPDPPRVESIDPFDVVVPVTNQRITIDRVWYDDCETCRDTGIELFWCGDSHPPSRHHARRCGRHQCPYDHEWVGPCGCVPTNPTIQRRLAARTYAQEAAPVRKGKYR